MWALRPAGQPGIAFGSVASSGGAVSVEDSVSCSAPETTAGPSAPGASRARLVLLRRRRLLSDLVAAAVVAGQLRDREAEQPGADHDHDDEQGGDRRERLRRPRAVLLERDARAAVQADELVRVDGLAARAAGGPVRGRGGLGLRLLVRGGRLLVVGRRVRARRSPAELLLQLAHLAVDLAELDRLLLQQLGGALALAVQLVDERAEVEQQRLALAAALAQAAPGAQVGEVSQRGPPPPLAEFPRGGGPSGRWSGYARAPPRDAGAPSSSARRIPAATASGVLRLDQHPRVADHLGHRGHVHHDGHAARPASPRPRRGRSPRGGRPARRRRRRR